MLIAVAGAHPGAGASTTALLLAAAWPTGQPVIVAETDPRGGQLARRCGGDPARGLASLTAAAGESGVYSLADLADHLQWHPAAVAYLAAPEQPGPLATPSAPSGFDLGGLARMGGPTGELVVVADCGLASRDSRAMSLLDSADVLLVVASQHHPETVLAARVRELAARFPGLALVLTGTSTEPDDLHARAAELGGRLIGWLPPPQSATPAVVDARDVGACAHALAAAVHACAGAGSAPGSPAARPRWRDPHRRRGFRTAEPRVYAITACPGDSRTHHRLATGTDAVTSLAAKPALASAPPPEPHQTDSGALCETTSASGAPHAPESGVVCPCLEVRLFGPLRVIWRPPHGIADHAGSTKTAAEVEITARLQPRSRELLVLLATHPHGLTRAQLVDALWGAQPPARPVNAVCTTVARLRNTLADITGDTGQPLLDTSSGRLRLNPAAVHVDFVEFAEAAARRRHSSDEDGRRRACTRLLELAAAGPVAADLDAEFLDPIRENVRRAAIAGIGVLARSFTGKDPDAALRLLESAIDIDPHNENFYRDMLRMYADLGQHYVIDNTVNLLTRRLAEIGEKPSRRTRELAKQLEDRAS